MNQTFGPSRIFSQWLVGIALSIAACGAHAVDQEPSSAVLKISELERCEVLSKTVARTRYRCGCGTLVAVSKLSEPPSFPARPGFEKPARTHPAAALFLHEASKQWATEVVPFSSTPREDGGTIYYGVVNSSGTAAAPGMPGHNAMFYVVDPSSQGAAIITFEGRGDGKQAFPSYRDAVLAGKWQ